MKMPKIPRWITGLIIAVPCGYLCMFPAGMAAWGLFRLNCPHATEGYGFSAYPAIFDGAYVGGIAVLALVIGNRVFTICSGILLIGLQVCLYVMINDPVIGSWYAFDSLALPMLTSIFLVYWGRRLRSAKRKDSATDDLEFGRSDPLTD